MKSRVIEKSFEATKFMQTLFFTSIASHTEAHGVAKLNESRGTCYEPFLRLPPRLISLPSACSSDGKIDINLDEKWYLWGFPWANWRGNLFTYPLLCERKDIGMETQYGLEHNNGCNGQNKEDKEAKISQTTVTRFGFGHQLSHYVRTFSRLCSRGKKKTERHAFTGNPRLNMMLALIIGSSKQPNGFST